MSSIAPVTSVDRPAATSPLRGGGEGGASFAELLQRGQASHGLLATAAPRPSPVPAPPAVAAGDGERDDRTPSEAEQARRQSAARAATKAAQRPRERPVAHAGPGTPEGTVPAEQTEASRPARPDDAPPTAEAAPPPTALATMLAAGWRAATTSMPDDDPATLDPTLAGAAAPGRALDGQTGALAAGGAPAGEDATGDDPPDAVDEAGSVAASAALALSQASTAAADTRPTPPPAPPEQAPLQGLAALTMPARANEPGAPPATTQSPEFAGQLAAQVSVWVADGVQQARLNLNPADMGPISVQIRIDGDQAQVAFAADAALTREAIERGLPELAAALREQGLTLSGGGVFEHRSGTGRGSAGRDGAAADPSAPRAEPAQAAPVGSRMLNAYSSGRLDVYA